LWETKSVLVFVGECEVSIQIQAFSGHELVSHLLPFNLAMLVYRLVCQLESWLRFPDLALHHANANDIFVFNLVLKDDETRIVGMDMEILVENQNISNLFSKGPF